ncbi:MAG: sulfurtransferase TusA family protein [Acidobacteriota bacterium]|nr:sulfurtransferase TusA family protein [Acidobacteriota bacterium]
MSQESTSQETVQDIHFDKVLDTSGLNCPMPVVKARKEVRSLEPGQTLKVMSTDRGSIKDFQGWAKVDKKVDLVGQQTDDQGESAIYVHFIQLVN